jgi:hypothetical protein
MQKWAGTQITCTQTYAFTRVPAYLGYHLPLFPV